MGIGSEELADPNGDSIYTKTVAIPQGAIGYKYFKTLRAGQDWEGVSDRKDSIGFADKVLPAVWFDNDSVFNPPIKSPVTFRVNMKIKLLEGSFKPTLGDIVTVRGNFNGWGDVAGTNIDTLKDADNDSIYTRTASFNEGFEIKYKYWKPSRGGIDYEPLSDFSYIVPVGGGNVPLRYFGNDSVYNAPVSGNFLVTVNVKPYQDLGWFRPDLKDSMEVRGGFNGWGSSTRMSPLPGQPGKYEQVIPFNGGTGDQFFYKFFLDFDSAGATSRLPGYIHSGTGATRDGFAYEHPALTGDGNNSIILTSGGNVPVGASFYAGINPQGLLKNATDSMTVTFKVNMGPAKSYVDAFLPATDTVKFVWEDALWRSAQVKAQTTFPLTVNMAKATGGGDSIYQVTFKVKGPTHYNVQYRYRYVHVGGNAVDQGGGLG